MQFKSVTILVDIIKINITFSSTEVSDMKNGIFKIVCLLVLIASMVILCACSGSAARQYQQEIEGLESTVVQLQTTITVLEAKIDVLERVSAGTMNYSPVQ